MEWERVCESVWVCVMCVSGLFPTASVSCTSSNKNEPINRLLAALTFPYFLPSHTHLCLLFTHTVPFIPKWNSVHQTTFILPFPLQKIMIIGSIFESFHTKFYTEGSCPYVFISTWLMTNEANIYMLLVCCRFET